MMAAVAKGFAGVTSFNSGKHSDGRLIRTLRIRGCYAPGQGSQSARCIISASTNPRIGCSKPSGIVPMTSNPR
jgi:hypothetical protein